MRIQYIKYCKYDWNIIIYYNTSIKDKKEILYLLKYLKCNKKDINKSIYLLNYYNKAFTCTNSKLKLSFVCINKTTNEAQFMNSLSHEIKHVVEDICATYDISLKGEESAYMIGEITMIMFHIFKDIICNC